MANSFAKLETVAFDKQMKRFEDQLTISNLFSKEEFPSVLAERSNNTMWRPMPYIAQSFTGVDQSANFNRNYTQLSVPVSLGYSHSVPLTLSATELRDQLQSERLGRAAMQRLASDINVDCSNLAALTGTVFVKRTSAASGFDDLAKADDAFNRVGVDTMDRRLVLASSDYNGMVGNLASRTMDNKNTELAYVKGYVAEINGFDVLKADYGYSLTAAAGVTVTMNGANQYYTPKATSTAGTGETSNVDNRYQTISITVSSGTVKVGDAFTIANVFEVHHITKASTGVLKTFRVSAIVTGGGGTGTIQISPPIISGGGGTDPELQYKNVSATPANGAALVWLNTAAGYANPFWQADAFEIVPGQYEPDPNAGLMVAKATTSNGITVAMFRQGAIGDLSTKYRWDVFYGLVNKQPQMTGVMMFSQP